MRTPRFFLSATLVSGALLSAALTAWAADVFDFIPLGGRSHLARVLAGRPADAVRAVVGAQAHGPGVGRLPAQPREGLSRHRAN